MGEGWPSFTKSLNDCFDLVIGNEPAAGTLVTACNRMFPLRCMITLWVTDAFSNRDFYKIKTFLLQRYKLVIIRFSTMQVSSASFLKIFSETDQTTC